jgi:hypothetical protein
MAIPSLAIVSDSDSTAGARLELEPEILAAISAGRKIEAIKLLRDEYGMGLVEAKDIADELMAARVAAAESGALPPMGGDAGVGGLIARSMEDGGQGGRSTNQAANGMPQPMQMETGIGRLVGVALVVVAVVAGYWLLD